MDLLLIEDDLAIGEAVSAHLRAQGHALQWCQALATAARAADLAPPDLAVMDLGLPDGDGLALLQRWRAAGRHWPVIVVSGRDRVADRIRGLRCGADDYLCKPVDLGELAARIDAVARRTATSTSAPAPPPLLRGGLQLDLLARQVHRDGQRVALTAMEWTVLACLASRPGRIRSRSEIDERLLDAGVSAVASNSLEVIVSRLRRKLGAGSISTHRRRQQRPAHASVRPRR